MTIWQTKQIADLANVSVKTLYHYDKIGLLSPSARAENGYRLYTEKDLFKLQQIIALKTLGFELAQIKKLLVQSVDVKSALTMQADLLQQKAKKLLSASNFITDMLSDLEANQSFDWHMITKLLEVSTEQFISSSWIYQLQSMCQNLGVEPSKICCEVTETKMACNVADYYEALTKIRLCGFQLSLDDFGTGYANMAILKSGPFNEVKIDKTFVDGMNIDKSSDLFISMVINVAKRLNLKVVVEGVETKSQLDYLKKYSNLQIQGYIFCKPFPYYKVMDFIT